MDRINGANTVDIGGERRGFRSQNKAAGVAGTELAAAWFNAVQEEILAVIEGADIVPQSGVWHQLRDAIGEMIATATSEVDLTGYVTQGGLTTAIENFITAGTVPGLQPFAASGTYTRSAGVTVAVAYVVGGGGAGGGCPAGSNNVMAGGGGGGEVRLVRFAPSATHAITIGAGGTGVANGNGGAGGSSSIGGGVCTANGGSGGLSSGNGSTGGAAGTGGSGGISLRATRGTSNYGAMQGGAAGGNFFGPGAPAQHVAPAAGIDGETHGAGGGGANGNNNTGGALAGGNGGGGLVLIWEFK
ncbi:MAG: hypothetical protein ABTQ29_03340 [Siculibacillus sp.]